MKLLVFAGSNSSTSINRQLAKYAAKQFSSEEVIDLDLNDFEMPIYSADREKESGVPQLAFDFLSHIKNCDFIVTSMAENNGNFSAAFKNIFDWCSRAEKVVFQNKPMLLMATSPGGRGGQSVLEIATATFGRFGADIKTTFSLPSFYDNFDAQNQIISHEEKRQELADKIQSLL